MKIEAYVFTDKTFRQQDLIEQNAMQKDRLYVEFKFFEIDGSSHPLFLEVESKEKLQEIKDVSIRIV